MTCSSKREQQENDKNGLDYEFLFMPDERLDHFLVRSLAERGQILSRSAVQKLIAAGNVHIPGQRKPKPALVVKTPQAIRIELPPPRSSALRPSGEKVPILHEDEWLAVVHKPAGMTVHPGAGTGEDTLVHALLGQVERLAEDPERPGIVHRLDRDTEGLMVIAKTQRAKAELSALFAAHRVRKIYTALVWGNRKLPAEWHGFIGRDPHHRKKMRYSDKLPTGIRVRTASLRVLKQLSGNKATRLEIELITGRTHQIRAACAFYQAPVVGDRLYGNDAVKYRSYKLTAEQKEKLANLGLQLYAHTLQFPHPATGEMLRFRLALPERFSSACQILEVG
ncbi:MAG: RluA family pseudouridine synthase [Turneriella sp.]|nr:RluA family pseudouridine synthase [Leptospiraceae bacterium]MCX7632728.1 RluA family pseudouridine synthase [Turneriella sp.]